jgi:hypothetical protein
MLGVCNETTSFFNKLLCYSKHLSYDANFVRTYNIIILVNSKIIPKDTINDKLPKFKNFKILIIIICMNTIYF